MARTDELLKEAGVLASALPYMRRHSGQVFVIKLGGKIMEDLSLMSLIAADIVLLRQVGIKPVVVHGGGSQISIMLNKLGIECDFVGGLRVTDKATMEIVEMVLAGQINKRIVDFIQRAKGKAVGISGKDCNLITAQKRRHKHRDKFSNIENVMDLGFVGEPNLIDDLILRVLLASEIIPVIAPIASGIDGETYNINADAAAGAIACALSARRLLLLTDVSGVKDEAGEVISNLTTSKAQKLIADKIATEGMIPKLNTCLSSVNKGVKAAVIIDGQVKHALLLEIFTSHGAGTMIKKDKER